MWEPPQIVTGAPKEGEAPLIKFSFTIPAIPVLNPEAGSPSLSIQPSHGSLSHRGTVAAEKTDVEMWLGDLVAYPIGLAIAVWYATTKNWLANDILGTAFCIQVPTHPSTKTQSL